MPVPRAVTLGFIPLALISSLLVPSAGAAQTDTVSVAAATPATPARLTFWLGGGYGAGDGGYDLEDETALEHAFSLNGSVQSGWLLLSVRLALAASSITDHSADYGILAGIASSPAHRFHAGAAVGLGHMAVTGGGFFSGIGQSAMTVPAEVQLSWRFRSWLALGVYGFMSVSRMDTFGGVTLGFQVGRLR